MSVQIGALFGKSGRLPPDVQRRAKRRERYVEARISCDIQYPAGRLRR